MRICAEKLVTLNHMTGQNINLSCEYPLIMKMEEIPEQDGDMKWIILALFIHYPLVFMTNIRKGESFSRTIESYL